MSERLSQREPHAKPADQNPARRRHTVGREPHLELFRPNPPRIHEEDPVGHDLEMPVTSRQHQLTTVSSDPLYHCHFLRHDGNVQRF